MSSVYSMQLITSKHVEPVFTVHHFTCNTTKHCMVENIACDITLCSEYN